MIGQENGTNNFCMLCFQGKNFQAASKKAEPPRLVMLKDGDNDQFSSGVILADRVVVECLDADGVLGKVLQLPYACYAWDLTYPKRYQLLGFIQQYVIKTPTICAPFRSALILRTLKKSLVLQQKLRKANSHLMLLSKN